MLYAGSSVDSSLSRPLALHSGRWAISRSAKTSGGSTELKLTEAPTQMSPFHVSGSQVFPASALTLAHRPALTEHLNITRVWQLQLSDLDFAPQL